MTRFVLTQADIEQAAQMVDRVLGSRLAEIRVNPLVLSTYNKLSFAKERIVLSGIIDQEEVTDYASWTSQGSVHLKGDASVPEDGVEYVIKAKALPRVPRLP